MNVSSTELETQVKKVAHFVLKTKKIDSYKIVKTFNDELIKRLIQFTIDKKDAISSKLTTAIDKDGVFNLILIDKAIQILKNLYEQEKKNLSKEDQDVIQDIIENTQLENVASSTSCPGTASG